MKKLFLILALLTIFPRHIIADDAIVKGLIGTVFVYYTYNLYKAIQITFFPTIDDLKRKKERNEATARLHIALAKQSDKQHEWKNAAYKLAKCYQKANN